MIGLIGLDDFGALPDKYKLPKREEVKPKKIYKIRKLTPRECFRLMGVTDEDITKIQNYPLELQDGQFVVPEGLTPQELKRKIISESQQYKMAGNSIVVDVLKGVFTQMFRKDMEALF